MPQHWVIPIAIGRKDKATSCILQANRHLPSERFCPCTILINQSTFLVPRNPPPPSQRTDGTALLHRGTRCHHGATGSFFSHGFCVASPPQPQPSASVGSSSHRRTSKNTRQKKLPEAALNIMCSYRYATHFLLSLCRASRQKNPIGTLC
jgi:hypothetical protein